MAAGIIPVSGFPLRWAYIFGWQVAAPGGRWRVVGSGVRPARPRMTGPVIPTLGTRTARGAVPTSRLMGAFPT